MANQSTNLDLISSAQAQKEVTANALFDAASPATLFGRRAAGTSGLTWGAYGGMMLVDGVLTVLNNTATTLTASQTNYIEATRAGSVSANTTGFTAGRIPLYRAITNASAITDYDDHRSWANLAGVDSRLALAMSDANTTLTYEQARNGILEFTGTLTAGRNIIVPNGPQQWTVFNNTNIGSPPGAYDLTVKTSAGTGVTIAATKRAIVYADGTNVVRVTSDV